MIEDTKSDPTENELTLLRSWNKFNSCILSFQKKADLFLFDKIFTDEHGQRLFLHFRFDCQHDFQKFITYLTVEQHNALLLDILRNPKFK